MAASTSPEHEENIERKLSDAPYLLNHPPSLPPHLDKINGDHKKNIWIGSLKSSEMRPNYSTKKKSAKEEVPVIDLKSNQHLNHPTLANKPSKRPQHNHQQRNQFFTKLDKKEMDAFISEEASQHGSVTEKDRLYKLPKLENEANLQDEGSENMINVVESGYNGRKLVKAPDKTRDADKIVQRLPESQDFGLEKGSNVNNIPSSISTKKPIEFFSATLSPKTSLLRVTSSNKNTVDLAMLRRKEIANFVSDVREESDSRDENVRFRVSNFEVSEVYSENLFVRKKIKFSI